jgi:hypothetical protein
VAANAVDSARQASELEDQVVPHLTDEQLFLAAQGKGKQIMEGSPPPVTLPPTTTALPTTSLNIQGPHLVPTSATHTPTTIALVANTLLPPAPPSSASTLQASSPRWNAQI